MPRSILINDYAGHPFQIELSTELATQGFDVVHAYCSSNVTPRGDLSANDKGPRVVSISTGNLFDKYNIRRRLVAEIRYGIASARLLRRERPDVTVNSNVPVISLAIIAITASLLRTRNVLWLQDLQAGLVAFALGNDRHPVARLVSALERWCIRRADHVVTISAGFEREALSFGAAAERLTTIANWAPIDDVPLQPRHNTWSTRHELDDRFVFMYSGTLGVKHRPEALITLAQAMTDERPEVMIVVVSEGVGAEWLVDEAARLGLANMMLLPFQPFDQLPEVLASADVLVALLEPDAGEFSVPSKVLTYLCAGRPILGLMPSTNAATKLVDDTCSGLVSEDADGFVANARRLAEDAALRTDLGAAGRTVAEARFDVKAIAEDFLEVLLPTSQAADGEQRTRTSNGVLT